MYKLLLLFLLGGTLAADEVYFFNGDKNTSDKPLNSVLITLHHVIADFCPDAGTKGNFPFWMTQ